MRRLLSMILASCVSVANAGVDYSGIWKDEQGTYYSIHQSSASIMVGEIHDNQVTLSPGEQGSISITNNELDLAINGNGFFVLVSEDGTYTYTRYGRFQLSSDHEIVNERGERLLTENQSSVPATTDGLEVVPGINADNLSSCNSIFECAPALEAAGTIIVSLDGSLSLHDSASGGVFKFDRIVLARVPSEQFVFSGYPIRVEDQSAVSYFYAGDEVQGEPLYYGASIYQGGLEQLSYSMKVWEGYFGDFDGSAARLSRMSDSSDDSGTVEEIHFTGDSSATITFECSNGNPFCNVVGGFQDRQLSKVY